MWRNLLGSAMDHRNILADLSKVAIIILTVRVKGLGAPVDGWLIIRATSLTPLFVANTDYSYTTRIHHCIIIKRERANLVVRSSGFLYYRPFVRRVSVHARLRYATSCKCACAASLRASLFPNFYTFSHTRYYAPIVLASERTLFHSSAFAANLGDWPRLYQTTLK